jgi:adenylate cyclase class 2
VALSGANQGRETEVKLRCGSAGEARALLDKGGFRETRPSAFERNEVFDTPDLALRAGRQLLRLREYGELKLLTYKGPPEPGPYKTREEIETAVGDAAALRGLLTRLGYEVVFRYEKYRAEYATQGGVALIDETPIGVFIELEGAPDWIDACAALLGFTPQHYITDSYGALYFAWCAEQGVEPAHMEFSQS